MKSIERFWLTHDIKISNNLLTWNTFNSKVKRKKLVLVGAGNVSEEFLKKYQRKYDIQFIVDSNSKKFGNKICGVKIVSEEEIKNIKEDFLILITSARYNDELKNKFSEMYGDKVFSLFDMEMKRMNRFKWWYIIKQRFIAPDSIFRSLIIFNILGLLRVLRFPGFYNYNENKITMLKKSQVGKRCFIIAPGPSLNKVDIEKLKEEITFAVNGAFKIYDDMEWKPNYYALLDFTTISRYRKENNRFNINSCAREKIFLTHLLKKDVIEDSTKIVYIHTSHLDHITKELNSPKIKYNENILWGHYAANTVTNFAINIADYMGIKEIYLLGVDCNYIGDKQYFDGSKNPVAIDINSAKAIQDGQIAGYEIIKKETEKRGVKIYNATRGGALEVFERVDFDSLFKEEKDV